MAAIDFVVSLVTSVWEKTLASTMTRKKAKHETFSNNLTAFTDTPVGGITGDENECFWRCVVLTWSGDNQEL